MVLRREFTYVVAYRELTPGRRTATVRYHVLATSVEQAIAKLVKRMPRLASKDPIYTEIKGS